MQIYHRIFRAFIAIALTASLIHASAAVDEQTKCVDNSKYRSPKLGLSCTQHKGLDCQEFGVLGYSSAELADLLLQCPSSCAVDGCASKGPSNNNDNKTQRNNNDEVQTSVQRSRSLRGLLPVSSTTTCPDDWDESCRDDPNFKSKLQLPCSGHVTFDCAVLGAIGFSLQDVFDVISHCPCSCGIECEAPTATPTSSPSSIGPSSNPAVTASASSSLSPTTRGPAQSPPAAPSALGDDDDNAIAQVITSDDSSQQQGHNFTMGSFSVSSSVFYGIVTAAAFVVLVAIVVVTRHVKASRQQKDGAMSSSKNSRRSKKHPPSSKYCAGSTTSSGKSHGTAKRSATRKTTSLKKKHSKRDTRTKRSTDGSTASRSSTSTSRAGSKSASGFKEECLQSRSCNTGTRAESTARHTTSAPIRGNCQDDIEAMSYTGLYVRYTTRAMPAEVIGGAKHALKGEFGAVPYGVSGLTDCWNSKSEKRAKPTTTIIGAEASTD